MREIFRGIVGSQAYGLATETSDTDYRSVYIQDNADLLSNIYTPRIEYSKDDVGYEIRRFLELANKADPGVLELLYLPENCIIHKTPEWDYLILFREKFLTRECYKTFTNYAKSQINKSQATNKKYNWEKHRTEKKDVLDHCTFLEKTTGKTYKIKDWLKQEGYDQSQVGLAKIDGFRDSFKLYLDELKWSKDNPPNHRFNLDFDDRGYRGIIGEDSLEPRLSEIELYLNNQWFGVLYFNREQYSIHCREYKEYQEWLSKRNEERVAVNKEHGQEYDSKNIMHLVRLMNEAEDIAIKKEIIVNRSFERDYLLSIKRGDQDLKELINQSEERADNLKELFGTSTLVDKCEINLNKLEFDLRHIINVVYKDRLFENIDLKRYEIY